MGTSPADANIDHRRVPNLATFFRRHGEALPVVRDLAAYRPGEIVVWRLPSGVPHVGILSDRASPSGWPLVIHNIGRGVREEDALAAFHVTARFRYLPAGLPPCDTRR